jgi:GTP cyclohydrolase I
MTTYEKPDMPDVAANQVAPINETIDWVGMSRIALPLTINDQDLGHYSAHTFIETYVDLSNPEVKGIHMSRLYLMLVEFSEHKIVTVDSLKQFIQDKLISHEDISEQACLNISFNYLINQPALKSEYSGWKDYPVSIKAQLNRDQLSLELGVKVAYSSTCPCSSALSRQLMQQAFSEDFAYQDRIDKATIEQWICSDRGSVATPHSQRSYADVRVKLDSQLDNLPISEMISVIEDALQTAVQTAVKREDEQEFARLNGANQMFCEDAARRLKKALNLQAHYHDFWLRVEHIESLHAHDAVAIVTKGIQDGYVPLLYR